MFLFALNIIERLSVLPKLPEAPSVDFSQPTWDLFIYLFFAIAILLFGFTLGRRRLISILLSVYLSLVVVNYLPYLDRASGNVDINLGIFAFKLSSFVIVFAVAFLVLSRSEILYEMAGPGKGIISSFIFSFLLVGMLLSITLGFLPDASLRLLSPFTKEIFASDLAKFVWIILPMAAMAVLRGEEN